MSFGRNPTCKSRGGRAEGGDREGRARARGRVARCAPQWERAAERETDDKRRQQYASKAEAARASADEPAAPAQQRAAEGEPGLTKAATAQRCPHRRDRRRHLEVAPPCTP